MAAVTQRAYFAEGIFAEGRGPRQRFDLPWACLCRGSYPRQRPLCRGPLFAEGSFVWPSAKSLFAECPIFGPRQSLRPSAKYAFPVVTTRLASAYGTSTTFCSPHSLQITSQLAIATRQLTLFSQVSYITWVSFSSRCSGVAG